MKFPAFLPKGGTVGFAAPSFGCNMEPYTSAFKSSLRFWESKGYRTLQGPNVFAGEGIGISNTPEKCGEELTDYYCSDACDVLISCGGGELMCETMDHVDFARIKAAQPKWFMGYSDNTNMAFLLTTLCDTASIYGPCAPAFGMRPLHPAVEDAYKVLTGEKLIQKGYARFETESLKTPDDPLVPYNAVNERRIVAYMQDGSLTDHAKADFSGRLVGGCLDCLVNLAGTNFDDVAGWNARYAQDGIIWFLEACDLNVYSIRRALWNLKHCGWFSNVKGFLIGRPLNGETMFGLDKYRAVTDMLGEFGVPVIMDLDIGHMPPMMPLVLGSTAHVTLNDQDFAINMELK